MRARWSGFHALSLSSQGRFPLSLLTGRRLVGVVVPQEVDDQEQAFRPLVRGLAIVPIGGNGALILRTQFAPRLLLSRPVNELSPCSWRSAKRSLSGARLDRAEGFRRIEKLLHST